MFIAKIKPLACSWFCKDTKCFKKAKQKGKIFYAEWGRNERCLGDNRERVSIRQEKRFDKLCRFCVWNVKYPKVCVIIRLYLFIDSLIK